MARAVAAYRSELKKLPGFDRKGARTICNDFEKLYHEETGGTIKLSYSTLLRLADGGRTKAQANASRSWLTEGEAQLVIKDALDASARGWPLTHKMLKEHVDEILRTRLGHLYPEFGVGKQWTYRFVQKYTDQLKAGWSSPLESIRGRAVNPHTHAAWTGLLGEEVDKVERENIWAADEAGLQESGGQKQWVIGGRRKPGPQYQQRGGTRDNITVVVTICADGTSTPPAVIFKGSGYQTKWGDDNPLNAS